MQVEAGAPLEAEAAISVRLLAGGHLALQVGEVGAQLDEQVAGIRAASEPGLNGSMAMARVCVLHILSSMSIMSRAAAMTRALAA